MNSVINTHATLQFIKHDHTKHLRADMICVYFHNLFTVIYFKRRRAGERQRFILCRVRSYIRTIFESHHQI